MKQVYFNEITYDGHPLVWEVAEDGSIRSNKLLATHNAIVQISKIAAEKINKPKNIAGEDLRVTTTNCEISGNLEDFSRKYSLSSIIIEGTSGQNRINRRLTLYSQPEFLPKYKKSDEKTSTESQSSSTSPAMIEKNQNEPWFSLEKIIPNTQANGDLWRKTLVYFTMSDFNEKKAKELKKNIITTADEIIRIKKLEHAASIGRYMNKRIHILKEIIEVFFSDLFNRIFTSDYQSLVEYFVAAISRACSNRNLDLPIKDEEKFNGLDRSSIPQQDLFEFDTYLENRNALIRVIDYYFQFQNLPELLRNKIDEAGKTSNYLAICEKLSKNILETSEQLKLNNTNITHYEMQIKNATLTEDSYTSLTDVIEQLFNQRSEISPVSSKKGELKSPRRNSGETLSACKDVLRKKIIEAFHIVNKRATDPSKTIFNSHVANKDKEIHFYIRSSYISHFHVLFAFFHNKTLQDCKELKNALEKYNINQLADAVETWLIQLDYGRNDDSSSNQSCNSCLLLKA